MQAFFDTPPSGSVFGSDGGLFGSSTSQPTHTFDLFGSSGQQANGTNTNNNGPMTQQAHLYGNATPSIPAPSLPSVGAPSLNVPHQPQIWQSQQPQHQQQHANYPPTTHTNHQNGNMYQQQPQQQQPYTLPPQQQQQHAQLYRPPPSSSFLHDSHTNPTMTPSKPIVQHQQQTHSVHTPMVTPSLKPTSSTPSISSPLPSSVVNSTPPHAAAAAASMPTPTSVTPPSNTSQVKPLNTPAPTAFSTPSAAALPSNLSTATHHTLTNNATIQQQQQQPQQQQHALPPLPHPTSHQPSLQVATSTFVPPSSVLQTSSHPSVPSSTIVTPSSSHPNVAPTSHIVSSSSSPLKNSSLPIASTLMTPSSTNGLVMNHTSNHTSNLQQSTYNSVTQHQQHQHHHATTVNHTTPIKQQDTTQMSQTYHTTPKSTSNVQSGMVSSLPHAASMAISNSSTSSPSMNSIASTLGTHVSTSASSISSSGPSLPTPAASPSSSSSVPIDASSSSVVDVPPPSASSSSSVPLVPPERKASLLSKAHALYEQHHRQTQELSKNVLELRSQLIQAKCANGTIIHVDGGGGGGVVSGSQSSVSPTASEVDPSETHPFTSQFASIGDSHLLSLLDNSYAIEDALLRKQTLNEEMSSMLQRLEGYVRFQVETEFKREHECEQRKKMRFVKEKRWVPSSDDEGDGDAAESELRLLSNPLLTIPDFILPQDHPVLRSLQGHIRQLHHQNSLTTSLLHLKNRTLQESFDESKTIQETLRQQISTMILQEDRREAERREEREMLVGHLKEMIQELAVENEQLKKEKKMWMKNNNNNDGNNHASSFSSSPPPPPPSAFASPLLPPPPTQPASISATPFSANQNGIHPTAAGPPPPATTITGTPPNTMRMNTTIPFSAATMPMPIPPPFPSSAPILPPPSHIPPFSVPPSISTIPTMSNGNGMALHHAPPNHTHAASKSVGIDQDTSAILASTPFRTRPAFLPPLMQQ